MNTTGRTITAVPCGKDRHGQPLTLPRTYTIVRDPEPFGDGRMRLWGVCQASWRHGLDRRAPLAVVWADSIRPEWVR